MTIYIIILLLPCYTIRYLVVSFSSTSSYCKCVSTSFHKKRFSDWVLSYFFPKNIQKKVLSVECKGFVSKIRSLTSNLTRSC